MEKNMKYWLLVQITLFLAITSNDAIEPIKDDSKDTLQDNLALIINGNDFLVNEFGGGKSF